MPIPVELPVANGSFQSASLPVSNQLCTNWYPVIPETAALSQEVLFGVPGSVQHATTGIVNQVNRGAWVFQDIDYVVNGTNLYRNNEDFSQVNIGVIPGNERVWMADNGTQLMIVANGQGWTTDGTIPGFTEILAAGFTANGTPETVVFINSYFVVTTDEKKAIFSAPNDGQSWNALDRFTAERNPDGIVAPFALAGEILYLGGSETFEAFQTTGTGDIFKRFNGGAIKKGIFSAHSLIDTDKGFMFIGGGKNEGAAIWHVVGGTPNKVSTTAQDSLLQSFTDEQIAQVSAWSYAQEGAYFVGFVLPTVTLVFDSITGRWHDRKSRVTDSSGITTTTGSRVRSVRKAYGRILIGDAIDGRIGELDPNVYTEYGDLLSRELSLAPIDAGGKSFSVISIELTIESGVGDLVTEDPQIRLSLSDDGVDFNARGGERMRSMGKMGKRNTVLTWYGNGFFERFCVPKFTQTDAVKSVIIKCVMMIEVAV